MMVLMFKLDSAILRRTGVLRPRGVMEGNSVSGLDVARAGTDAGLLALLVAVLAVVAGAHHGVLAVHLHVLPQGRGVGVALVAAPHFTVVRLVRGVDMRMLLPIT